MDTSDTPKLEIFNPSPGETLTLARNFLVKSITSLLDGGHYNAATTLVTCLQQIDQVAANVFGNAGVTPGSNIDSGLTSVHDTRFTVKEMSYIKSNQKIAAIKEVRSRTGLGLKEAKDLVESYRP